jgi:hypothetical protein
VTSVTVTPEKKTVSWASVAKEVSIPTEIIAKHTKISYNIMSATTKALSN